jgi:hypothetical protein
VGNLYDDNTYTDDGSVYVYRWSGSLWKEYKLTASDGASDSYFGFSVSLSGDGNTVAVGATRADSEKGAVYIFIFDGDNYGIWKEGTSHWDENQLITPSDPASSKDFGSDISLSSNGEVLLIGAHYDDDLGSSAGAAYVYILDNSYQKYGKNNEVTLNWDENQKITASDGVANDQFGYNVSLSSDASTAIIGAIHDEGNQSDSGTVYIYRWDHTEMKYGSWNSGSSHWDENQKIYADDGLTGDWFGRQVFISSTGNEIIISSYKSDIASNTDQGAVYLFRQNGSTYVQEKKFTASDGEAEDYYGYSISISGDGNRVLIGSKNDTVGTNDNQGSIYLYDWNGNTWIEKKVTSSDGAEDDYFGYAAGLSRDSHTIVISAPGADIGGNNNQGAFYIY